jgi:hypothetical protein
MKLQNIPKYRYQRDWRRGIIKQLKDKIGNYCQQCSSPDNWHMQVPAEFLELFIKDRRAEDLATFGNNTVMIYKRIVEGKIPLDRVVLLCPDCKYERRYKELGNSLEGPQSGDTRADQREAEAQVPAASGS